MAPIPPRDHKRGQRPWAFPVVGALREGAAEITIATHWVHREGPDERPFFAWPLARTSPRAFWPSANTTKYDPSRTDRSQISPVSEVSKVSTAEGPE